MVRPRLQIWRRRRSADQPPAGRIRCVFLAGCVDYYSHLYYYDASANPVHDLWDNGREVYRNGEYLTELFTDKAVEEIRRMAATDRPFFLYLAYNAPHYPMHAPAHYVDRFHGMAPGRRIMAAMVSVLDDGVGAVEDELVRCGIEENTLVLFMSDNGPSPESRNWLDGETRPYDGGSTGGLCGQKFSLFEGGIRVPAMLSWKARIPAGQVVDDPLIAMDLAPTLLAAAGIPPESPFDGVDLLPLFCGGAPLGERTLHWGYRGAGAVRRGPWKLIAADDECFLANLGEDRGEQVDLAAERPAVLGELQESFAKWQAQW